MIRSSELLEDFERCYGREAFRGLTYAEALARFTALWVHARALNPDFGSDWREDVEADIAVARAVNGLPPTS